MLQILIQTINGYLKNFMSRNNYVFDHTKYIMTITITTVNEDGLPVTVTNTVKRSGRDVAHSESYVVSGQCLSYRTGKTTLTYMPKTSDMTEVVSDAEVVEEQAEDDAEVVEE